jgi:putative oxidoreductase
MPSFFITLSDLLEIDRIIHRGGVLRSYGLICGFIGRVAAGGLFIIMTGVMITHLPQGWFMNWFGKKGGEGIEYFVVLLTCC